ncbi:Imm1 family immunity protein [Micromonospora pisi]|nr:Imm1 family immunity protein [Micromonospora pisi]
MTDIPLADPEHGLTEFDEHIHLFMPFGGQGQSLWFSPEPGAEPELRVDIDIAADRAALNWLADDTYAVELPPGPPIRVQWATDAPVVDVPGETARVSVDTARRAVRAYLSTGGRPGGLEWVAEEPDVGLD